MALVITALNSACPVKAANFLDKDKVKNKKPHLPNIDNKTDNFDNFRANMAMLNKLQFFKKPLSFKGYDGDTQPLKKLFWNLTYRDNVYTDNWTNEHLYQVGRKKWVNASAKELVKRTPEQAIQSALTLIKPDYADNPFINGYIPSPDFGSKWGRRANYIEINPRIVAKYENGNPTEGLFGVMKLLPAIPPSPDSFANCIVLSQLYPSISDDKGSLYCTDLHRDNTISSVLLSSGLYAKMGADEQVKAFNDFSHMLGFKTGFRMPVLAGELKIRGQNFDWNNPGHRKAYIDACVWGLELGFDAIYFDSAKHVINKDGMTPFLGEPPNPHQMSEILYLIRKNSHKEDASFIGEKCYNDPFYGNVGFTAGTDWGRADSFESVKWESKNQAWMDSYAAGPEVSNDNDTDSGDWSYSKRLNRINSCLFGFDDINHKLPSYMQLNDIFPLSGYTNTHEQMKYAKEMDGHEGMWECERHWNGIFDSRPCADEYRNNVYHIFENVIRTFG